MWQRKSRVSLFLEVICPLEQTSSGILLQLNPASVISLLRNSYLALFLALAASMFLLNGTVSSTSNTEEGEVLRLMITISGLQLVTIIYGGIVPPLTFAPSMSA